MRDRVIRKLFSEMVLITIAAEQNGFMMYLRIDLSLLKVNIQKLNN